MVGAPKVPRSAPSIKFRASEMKNGTSRKKIEKQLRKRKVFGFRRKRRKKVFFRIFLGIRFFQKFAGKKRTTTIFFLSFMEIAFPGNLSLHWMRILKKRAKLKTERKLFK